MKDKIYDIDRLTQEELIEGVENMRNNIVGIEDPKGIISVKNLIKEYEKRIKK